MLQYTQKTIMYSPYTAIIALPNKLPHVMDFWKITYAISGSSVNVTNNVQHTLTKNTILIIKPGLPFQTVSYTDKTYRHRDIYISDEDMRKFCSYLPQNPYDDLCAETPFFEVNILAVESLESMLNLFPANNPLKNDYLSSLHTSVVINLLALYLENKASSLIKPEWLIALERRTNEKIFLQNNVEFLIKDTPYSHSHICREFRKYNNITLTEYLTRAKIIHSNILLMNKQNSITDIAYALGFSTQSSFIKAYKRYFKLPPSVYRKKYFSNKSQNTTNIWGKNNHD